MCSMRNGLLEIEEFRRAANLCGCAVLHLVGGGGITLYLRALRLFYVFIKIPQIVR